MTPVWKTTLRVIVCNNNRVQIVRAHTSHRCAAGSKTESTWPDDTLTNNVHLVSSVFYFDNTHNAVKRSNRFQPFISLRLEWDLMNLSKIDWNRFDWPRRPRQSSFRSVSTIRTNTARRALQSTCLDDVVKIHTYIYINIYKLRA